MNIKIDAENVYKYIQKIEMRNKSVKCKNQSEIDKESNDIGHPTPYYKTFDTFEV